MTSSGYLQYAISAKRSEMKLRRPPRICDECGMDAYSRSNDCPWHVPPITWDAARQELREDLARLYESPPSGSDGHGPSVEKAMNAGV